MPLDFTYLNIQGSYFTRSPLFNLIVPTLSLVGDPLTGNGCGSPNYIPCILFVIPLLLTVLFTDFYSSYICIKRRPVSS